MPTDPLHEFHYSRDPNFRSTRRVIIDPPRMIPVPDIRQQGQQFYPAQLANAYGVSRVTLGKDGKAPTDNQPPSHAMMFLLGAFGGGLFYLMDRDECRALASALLDAANKMPGPSQEPEVLAKQEQRGNG